MTFDASASYPHACACAASVREYNVLKSWEYPDREPATADLRPTGNNARPCVVRFPNIGSLYRGITSFVFCNLLLLTKREQDTEGLNEVKRKKRKYSLTPEQVEKVRERCRKLGLSRKGKKLNLSPERRKEIAEQGKRLFSGKKNFRWKGKSVGYRSLHNWVQNRLGTPTKCTKCLKDGLQGRKIHWANISGKYKRITKDWVRLCVKCHSLFDNEKRNAKKT